ncbi:hypothetical protein QZM33_19635 [Burkholderia vietnamiensis]|jgi:hypothetical protein|uniref:Uncharacterized protein n=1 Tax=Burkholderia vietnamiensis TaxID=60552 RepID=A0AAW7T2X6_BURVI|nr:MULTISPECIES: hypothetical protein [Burkholderia cepacia complex]MDN7797151.1 hypothetical protein [Burkholderia vietnamiensis]
MGSCCFARHENCPDILQAVPMRLPEVSQLVFAIDQLDAVRKPMVDMLGVIVMKSIPAEISGMNAMQNGLLDSGAFRVTQ